MLGAPNDGLLEARNEPSYPNKKVVLTLIAMLVLVKFGVVVEQKAWVLTVATDGEIMAPDAKVLQPPNIGWLDAPKGDEEPNRLLPNTGCDC